MEKILFEDLKQSLKEAKAIRAGEMNASRRFTVNSIDIKAVPAKLACPRMNLLR
ncbi:hypothetical protein [Leucothrix pacifica]|uniref:hypothetical protein n=1 Tax=Leucothrix pacifica TaxID=1247513 RepID=UPI001C63C9C1|nr:hypothetical protein [Leucothrix pacifica]